MAPPPGPPADMSGPGLLFVTARISRPDIMDEPMYMKWYDEDHIAEIVATSGIDTAFRYIRADKAGASFPYLALYPMEDVAFMMGPEFKKISVHSKLLPGSGLVYDLADNEVRYYGLKEVIDGTNKGKGHTKSIIPAQFELKDGYAVDKFEEWAKNEHIPRVSKLPGYLRSTKFKLHYARTNAQSRALKGLPTTDEPGPDPPTWMFMHEFESDDVQEGAVKKTTEGGDEGVDFEVEEMPVYRIAKTHGKGDWFHGQAV